MYRIGPKAEAVGNREMFFLFDVLMASNRLELIAVTLNTAATYKNQKQLREFLLRWLVLFVPYDIFNKILYFELGDIMPVFLLISLLTTLRQIISVDDGMYSKASIVSVEKFVSNLCESIVFFE